MLVLQQERIPATESFGDLSLANTLEALLNLPVE